MKSSNRILIGFGAGIAVLLIITVVLALTLGQKSASLLPQDTPQGSVQRYLMAVQDKDYAKAYSYIAPLPTPTDVKGGIFPVPAPFPGPNSFDFWKQSAQNASNITWKTSLNQTTVTGDNATVEIAVDVFRPGGPFSNPVSSRTMIFSLQRQGGVWLITSPTDLYWIY